MASRPWYVTREHVKRALDIASTARRDDQVDEAIEAASQQVDGLLNRRFYPRTATETFDWPPRHESTPAYILRMNERELASAAGVVVTTQSGTVTLTAGQYVLRPDQGPPYNRLEILLSGTGSLSSAGTYQRAIGITGVWMGQALDDRPAGVLSGAISSTSTTSCTVTDASQVGIGTILLVGTERMIVTGRSQVTTGQTSLGALDADEAAGTITVTSGAALHVGEVITIDSEVMVITNIAGNTVTVARAEDGSTLAAHLAGATIYAARTLTVERGALGTTAATHTDATALYRHTPLAIVQALTRAYAINTLLQESSGYARVAGSGDNAKEFTGRGIKALEDDATAAVGRKARYRGVR